ncbi:hypothetical protein T06_14220 [Trichinella sp. T6]|nr:hypothetical protein T06_14220 [Trichinella sp. T6]
MHGISLTLTGAAICRDNDLADGVRVLSSSYPRLLATSPWPVSDPATQLLVSPRDKVHTEDGEWCSMSFQRPLYQPGLCQLPYGDSRLTAERLPGIAIVSGVFWWNSSTQTLLAMHNYQQGWSQGLG